MSSKTTESRPPKKSKYKDGKLGRRLDRGLRSGYTTELMVRFAEARQRARRAAAARATSSRRAMG